MMNLFIPKLAEKAGESVRQSFKKGTIEQALQADGGAKPEKVNKFQHEIFLKQAVFLLPVLLNFLATFLQKNIGYSNYHHLISNHDKFNLAWFNPGQPRKLF